MKAIILAAGVGSRIGHRLPKCLTELPNGKTILENQIHLLNANGINEIIIVVGFKKELIMEYYPDVLYRYNPLFHVTNTAKSLMLAFQNATPDDTLWLNGDVYLESKVLERVIQTPGNVVAVNTAVVGDEEVKYRTDLNGYIVEISKKVVGAQGEAVGVNKISQNDFHLFYQKLQECKDQDYFERAMELAIADGVKFRPVDVGDLQCVEIDFRKDLELVRRFFRNR